MNIMKKLAIALMLISMSYSLAAAEELTLSDAIQRGLKNNFDIRVAHLQTKITENNDSWGAAGRFPTLTLSLTENLMYNDKEDSTTITGRDQYWYQNLNPNINLNWVLFNGFSISLTKDKLELLDSQMKGNSAIVVENTIQAIILGYYKVLLENEKLKVLDEVMALSKDRYDYEITAKEIGSSVTYDVLQAKVAYLGDKANRLQQEISLKSAQRSLNLVLGEPVESEFELTDSFQPRISEYTLVNLEEKMLSNNKTLKNQYINQEILKNSVSLSRSSRWPTISVNVGADADLNGIQYSGMDSINTTNYAFYVNFAISYNVYSGGNVERSVVNAKIQEAIGKIQIEQMVFSLKNQMRTTYEFYQLRKQLLNVSDESVETNKINLEISSDKFKAGAINSFNYRDVQLLYLNSSFGRLQAIYNLLETDTELMRLSGGIITEQDK
ncbi:MAG: TolC family protein [Acidobacteria bacterium]|nr:TolC family protein [Acidobacteriota bacterium]